MSAATQTPDAPSWYSLTGADAAERLGVDAHAGLTTAEADSRRAQYGPNKFAETKAEPRWHAFVRQYRDLMQIVLLVVGIGSLWPLRQYGTGIVVLFLTVFNAVLGLHQEGKAAEAVAALQKMMIVKAKVTRDGGLAELPAEELVPGDIVAIEAGDVVPADGRLLEVATLEVAESALTGESLPVGEDGRSRRGRGHAARRPHGHGLHEHERHPRLGAVRRHRNRDVDRGRPHLEHAAVARRK